MQSDKTLERALKNWAKGLPEALNQVMTCAKDRLTMFASAEIIGRDKIGKEDPDEVVNELFLKLATIQNISNRPFETSGDFLSYAKIAMKELITKGNLDESEEAFDEFEDFSLLPEETVARKVIGKLIYCHNPACFEQNWMEIAELHLEHGYSFEEVAEILETSPTKVETVWDGVLTWLIRNTTDIRRGRHPESDVLLEKSSKISLGQLLTLEVVDQRLLDALSRDPMLLKNLEWRMFEKVLAELLGRLGYQIELQQGTKDGGVDIFAIKQTGAFGSHRYLLQAKRWTNPVGVEPVRELLFLHNYHKVTKSCLATTSRFTKGAVKLAADYRWQLELRDYNALKEWVSMATQIRSA